MNKYKPFFLPLLIGIVFSFAVLWQSSSDSFSDIEKIQVNIHSNSVESVRLWSSKDGELYVFLPSYAQLKNCTWQIPMNVHALLGDTPLHDGDSLDVTLNSKYRMTINGQTYAIRFVQSANVATMYLSTQEQSFRRLLEDKTRKIPVSLLLMDSQGSKDYSTSHTDYLRGHGNSTWRADKKPFNLYLDNAAPLLGNAPGVNWVLLANAYDHSNVRNSVIFDIAHETSEQWNPHASYVDVYVNGQYQGLYLLAEKVEAAPNRLPLEPNDILLNFELSYRALTSPYIRDILPGISAEVSYIAPMQMHQWDTVRETIQTIFSELQSHSIPEGSLDSYFDLDSWAWLYIMQEISTNQDGGRASLFFLLREGRLYASAVWDCDLTFGASSGFSNTYLLGEKTVLWNSLMQYPEFSDRVISLYQNLFAQAVVPGLEDRIADKHSVIADAAACSEYRWPSDPNVHSDLIPETDYEHLIQFVRLRLPVLNDYLVEGKRFYNASLCFSNGEMWHYCVPEGMSIADYCNITETDWLISETGEPYDISAPLLQNLNLRAPIINPIDYGDSDSAVLRASHIRIYTALVCIAVFGILGIGLFLTDFRRERAALRSIAKSPAAEHTVNEI